MTPLKKISACFDHIVDILGLFSAALVGFTMIGICAEISLRNLIGWPMAWIFEMTEYSLLFMAFFGAARLLKIGGHIRMDIVFNLLKPRTQILLNVINSIICAIVCLVYTFYGFKTTWYYFQSGVAYMSFVEPPWWIIISAVPLGFCLLFIQFLRIIYDHLRALKSYEKVTRPL
jgi:TRAP-type C4-dicarboxylate transport system permease small subunit